MKKWHFSPKKNILLLDNLWDTKSLCELRRVFPVIILRVYKHFFNISETWLIDEFIFPEMMWLLAKKLFSSCTQFEGRLPLEWTEFFTCSKKLGESISPSQGRNISPLLCSWAGMWSHLGQSRNLCYNWAHCTEFTLRISAGWTPVCNFGTRLAVRIVGDTEGEKRYMFYFWAV